MIITESVKNNILKEAKQIFTQPFLNRIDKIVFFNNLEVGHIEKIIELKINEFNEELIDKQINIILDDLAKQLITKMCYNKEEGARAVRKITQDLILTPLIEGIISGNFTRGDTVTVTLEGDKIVLKK